MDTTKEYEWLKEQGNYELEVIPVVDASDNFDSSFVKINIIDNKTGKIQTRTEDFCYVVVENNLLKILKQMLNS